MPEARLENSGSGLAPVTDGWFVVNVRDAEWWFADSRGAACRFESEYGDPPVEFGELARCQLPPLSGGRWRRVAGDELPDLGEGEPGSLRHLDQGDAANRGGRPHAASSLAVGAGQQAAFLPVAKR